jgi:hypothetical protein
MRPNNENEGGRAEEALVEGKIKGKGKVTSNGDSKSFMKSHLSSF